MYPTINDSFSRRLMKINPPTPRRVGIKSQPTDIDSPDDRYIPGNPTPGETRGSLLSGAIPVRFFSHGGGGGRGSGPLFTQPADQLYFDACFADFEDILNEMSLTRATPQQDRA